MQPPPLPRLEHVNLVVSDLEATLRFLQTAFPTWSVRGRGDGTWFGRPRRWLHLGTDTHYITLNDGSEGEARDLHGHTPGLAHVGFEVHDLPALRERMEAAGYTVAIEGGDHPHRRTLYFHDPTGIEFEFVEYLSSDPAERNLYGGETSAVRRYA